MLSKMGVTSKEFEKDIKEYSEGQKKKVFNILLEYYLHH